MAKSSSNIKTGNFTDFDIIFNGSCSTNICTFNKRFNSSRATLYYFRVFAWNQLGYNVSAYNEAQNQSINTPSQPLSLRARINGVASIALTWAQPVDTGVGDTTRALLRFMILRSKQSLNMSCDCYCETCSICMNCSASDRQCCNLTVSGQTFSANFSGMPIGPSRYYFAVTAANDAGFGNLSQIVNEQSINKPGTPMNLSVYNVAPSTATLNWSKPADTGVGTQNICGQDCRNITGYLITCAAIVDGIKVACNQTENLQTAFPASVSQVDVHGLNHKADNFSFQVSAVNDAGVSTSSIVSPVFSIEVPSQPLSVSAKISDKPYTIDVVWSPPLDTGRGGSKQIILAYIIEMSQTGNFSNVSDVLVLCSGQMGCTNCTCREFNMSVTFATFRENPFFFRVAARNIVGFGPYSFAASACIGLASQPLNLTASAGPGPLIVRLFWNNPLDMGWGQGRYRALLGFRVYRAFNDSLFSSCSISAVCNSLAANISCCYYDISNISNFSDTMPAKGPSYFYFKIEARNEAGLGPASLPAKEQGVGVPGPPQNLTIEVLEPGDRFYISWFPPADFGLGPGIVSRSLSSYLIEICQGPINSSTCAFPPLGNLFNFTYLDPSTQSFTSNNFPGGKTYFFRVAAQNNVSLGNWSSIVFKNAISLSFQPQGFQAVVMMPLQINLMWQIPLDTGDGSNTRIPVTSYIINVSSNVTFIDDVQTIFVGLGFSFNYTGLSKGRTYFFRIWARTAAGISSSYGSAIEQGITVPSAPPNLFAKSDAPLTIRVNWTSPIDTGLGLLYSSPRPLLFYLLEVEKSAGASAAIDFSNATRYIFNSSTFMLTNVSINYFYYFRVQAWNSAGHSNFSSVQSERGIDRPSPPQGFVAYVSGSVAITVSWASPLNTGLGQNILPSQLLKDDGYLLQISNDNFMNDSLTTMLYFPNNSTFSVFDLLIKNGTYYFKIQSRNVVGFSSTSSILKVLAISLPSAARNLQVSVSTIHERELVLSWSSPFDTGGGDSLLTNLQHYRLVQKAMNGSDWVTENITLGPLTNILVRSNLTKGSIYFFQIFASNAAGEGNGSVSVSEMALDKPTSPYALMAYISGPISIFVKWNIPNDTGNGLDAINARSLISQKIKILAGTSTIFVDVPGDIVNYTLRYPDIHQGNLCEISISAENSAGFSAWSEFASQTAIDVPTAPQNLVASIPGPLSILLTWMIPINTGSIGNLWPLLNYSLEVSSTQLFLDQRVLSRTLNSSYLHVGLVQGQKYFYKVYALNEAGKSVASDIAFDVAITAPTAPLAMSVHVSGEYQLLVVWSLPRDTGAGDQSWQLSGYSLEWDSALRSNGTFISLISPEAGSFRFSPSIQRHLFSGLIKGNTYYFRISASNEAGVSSFAGPVAEQAMILPNFVLEFQFQLISIDGQGAWNLAWQAPSETGTGNISFGAYPIPSTSGTALAIIDYIVQAGPSNSGILSVNWSAFTSLSPDLNATIQKLVPNFIYYFRIAAVNKVGQGPWLLGGNTGPSISSISPKIIPAAGGTAITINGKRFGNAVLNLMGTIGATKCLSMTLIHDDTSVKCVSPAGTGGRKDLILTVAGLSVRVEGGIQYDAPIITSISPSSVTSEESVKLSILGVNFGAHEVSAQAVIVGKGSDVCAVTEWISDSSMFCYTPMSKRSGNKNTIRVFVDGVQSKPDPDVYFEYTDLPSYLSTCNRDTSNECFDCVVSACYSSQIVNSFGQTRTLLTGDVLQFCELAAAQFCGYQDSVD